MVLKWKDDHAPLVLDLMISHECLCNTKSEHRRKKTAGDNAQHETVQELNFPAVTVEDVKFESKKQFVPGMLLS